MLDCLKNIFKALYVKNVTFQISILLETSRNRQTVNSHNSRFRSIRKRLRVFSQNIPFCFKSHYFTQPYMFERLAGGGAQRFRLNLSGDW